ncbi:unnamed protein product [Urochloa humidicola]
MRGAATAIDALMPWGSRGEGRSGRVRSSTTLEFTATHHHRQDLEPRSPDPATAPPLLPAPTAEGGKTRCGASCSSTRLPSVAADSPSRRKVRGPPRRCRINPL